MRLRSKDKLNLQKNIKFTNMIQDLLAQIDHQKTKIKEQHLVIKNLRKKRQCYLVYPVESDKIEHLIDDSLEKIDSNEIIKTEFYNKKKQMTINRLKDRNQIAKSSSVTSMVSENRMLVDGIDIYFNT